MEAKKFDFTFKFLGKDYEAQYTIELTATKDNKEEQRFYVDFENDDPHYRWKNRHLFSYDVAKDVINFSPISPSDFDLISTQADAIIMLEYLNPENH